MNLKFYWPAKYSTVPLFSCKLLVIFKAFINKLVKSSIGPSHDVLAEAAALHGALTASVSADSGMLSTAATFTDASPPIPSRCRLSGMSFRAFHEITQYHFNVDRMVAIFSDGSSGRL